MQMSAQYFTGLLFSTFSSLSIQELQLQWYTTYFHSFQIGLYDWEPKNLDGSRDPDRAPF